MRNADAAERARGAARARWTPSPVVSRAVTTVTERADELSAAQLAELAAVLGTQEASDE